MLFLRMGWNAVHNSSLVTVTCDLFYYIRLASKFASCFQPRSGPYLSCTFDLPQSTPVSGYLVIAGMTVWLSYYVPYSRSTYFPGSTFTYAATVRYTFSNFADPSLQADICYQIRTMCLYAALQVAEQPRKRQQVRAAVRTLDSSLVMCC